MKPAPFRYLAPASLAEALDQMAQYGADARPLAGGQSLVASLNFRCLKPAVLVDLNPLPGLSFVRVDAQGEVVIGAMTRQRTLEFDPLLAGQLPLLHAAVPYIAHAAIRNRGTLGGSLSYSDPASELPAVTLALGARYKAASARGERWIRAEDFFTGLFANALAPDELLVEVALPPVPPRTTWGFQESSRRLGDRVMLGVAAWVTLDAAGVCREARLAYMNAAPTPLLARSAARALVGEKASPQAIQAAAGAAQDDLQPLEDVHASPAFKRSLARELTVRALTEAFARAGVIL